MENHITIRMDLGDKYHVTIVFDAEANEVEVAKISKRKADMGNYFSHNRGSAVAIEGETHSPS